MKKIGIVTEYDKTNGKILSFDNKEHLLMKKELLNQIKKGDIVKFDSEKVDTTEGYKLVARFIEKHK